MATELKDTLLLPKTDFPMRAGLVQREPGRVAHWEQLDLYNQIQPSARTAPRAPSSCMTARRSPTATSISAPR
jgi:hypothetical protein